MDGRRAPPRMRSTERHPPSVKLLWRARDEHKPPTSHSGVEENDSVWGDPRRAQPRPTYGIAVASTVANCTFASSGSSAMCRTVRATSRHVHHRLGAISPFAWSTPGPHPRRSSPSPRCRCRSARRRCGTAARPATGTWSGRSARAWSPCRRRSAGAGRVRGDRAVVDDPAALRVLLLHQPERRLRAQERPGQVGVHDRRQSSYGSSSTGTPPGPNIPALLNSRSSRPNRSRTAANSAATSSGSYIRRHDSDRGAAGPPAASAAVPSRVSAPPPGQRHRPARAQQFEGDRAADAGARAGHDRDPRITAQFASVHGPAAYGTARAGVRRCGTPSAPPCGCCVCANVRRSRPLQLPLTPSVRGGAHDTTAARTAAPELRAAARHWAAAAS